MIFAKSMILQLATCHYANENQKWMKDQGLPFVSKDQNPPNAPQIRPIERFWAILKFLVYEGNWSAQNREQLIRRIKWAIAKYNRDNVVRMMEALPQKIRLANENGLNSVL